MVDGEAVILGVDGRSDFNALHSNKQNGEVQLCAFDVLAIGGEDLRALPLSMRKTNLERLLRGRPDGIFVNPFEIGASGPELVPRRLPGGSRRTVSSSFASLASKSRIWSRIESRQPYCAKISNSTTPAVSETSARSCAPEIERRAGKGRARGPQ